MLQQSPQSEQQDHPNYSAMPLDLNSMKPFFQIGFVICYRFRAWRSFPIDLFDQFSLVFAWLITACLKWGQIPSQITCVLLGVCYAQFSKRIFFCFVFFLKLLIENEGNMQFVSVGGNFMFNLHDLYLMSKLPVHTNLHQSVHNPSWRNI